MRSLLFRVDDRQRDVLITALWEGGTSGIIDETAGVRAFFEEDADTAGIEREWRRELIEKREEPVGVRYEASTDDWDGICVGERFFLAPPCVTVPPPDDRIRITIDPGAAFGTGRHETTQMMIERLESVIRGGETVLDVGCGSGVLSEVCRLLGAGAVLGCDIDPLAVSAAAANFSTPVFVGSADAIRPECADVLLVNISARVIDLLAAELKRIAKPDAVVLLAGFVVQSPPTCFRPENAIERNEWLCWTGSRDSFSSGGSVPALIHPKQWW